MNWMNYKPDWYTVSRRDISRRKVFFSAALFTSQRKFRVQSDAKSCQNKDLHQCEKNDWQQIYAKSMMLFCIDVTHTKIWGC